MFYNYVSFCVPVFAFSGTYALLFFARSLQGIGSSFSSVAGTRTLIATWFVKFSEVCLDKLICPVDVDIFMVLMFMISSV